MDLLHKTAHEILATDDPWPALQEAGLTTVGIPEEAGGSGGSPAEAAALIRIAAYHAAPIPLAETSWLAGWLLAEAGMPLPPGRLAFMQGTSADRVPWASSCDHLVVLADGLVAVVDPATAEITPGRNLAGEPRDQVALTALPPENSSPTAITADTLRLRGALARAVQISGAARRALDLSVAYAREREQFGRPIARFQAVQSMLAELAGEVAVLDAAVQAAVALPTSSSVSAAKASAGRAAGVVARLAHQIHGAIGVTEEHRLGRITLRLWSWREEYGNEAFWEARLGALREDPWDTIVG